MTMTDRRRRRGLSLIEVCTAIALLAFVFMALFSSLLSSSQLSSASSEEVVALQCAQNQIEKMKAAPFSTVFTNYYKAGGQGFAVTGLGPQAQGTITFLSESQYAAVTGAPVDLDQDGATTGTVPNTSYAYFPIQATVTWRSRSSTTASSPMRSITITSAIFHNPGLSGN
jgi:Tfp pilus assembly protein PilV